MNTTQIPSNTGPIRFFGATSGIPAHYEKLTLRQSHPAASRHRWQGFHIYPDLRVCKWKSKPWHKALNMWHEYAVPSKHMRWLTSLAAAHGNIYY